MADPVKLHQDCSERVYHSGSSWRGSHCAKPGKVQRPVERRVYPDPVQRYDEATFSFTEERLEPVTVVEQKWFCATHDPVAKSERDARRRDEESRAWRAKQKREADYREATERAARVRQDVIDAAKALTELLSPDEVEAGPVALRTLVAAVKALEGK